MWVIWCKDTQDWLREMPSKVDEGGEAILCFSARGKACDRAAKHYGFSTYHEAFRKGWCVVRIAVIRNCKLVKK